MGKLNGLLQCHTAHVFGHSEPTDKCPACKRLLEKASIQKKSPPKPKGLWKHKQHHYTENYLSSASIHFENTVHFWIIS